MSKVDSMRCTFCHLDVENISHLFFNCTQVRHIWLYIESIFRVNGYDVKLQCKDVIFGYGFENTDWKKYMIVNNIILEVKAFIWNCKKCNNIVSEQNFKAWIGNKTIVDKNVEKFIDMFR